MNINQITKEGAAELNNLLKFIEEFRKYHAEVQAQTIASFLYIANWKLRNPEEPIYVKDIAEAVGLPSATASRNVTLLGRGGFGKQGMGLVETKEDVTFRTRKVVNLTPKGKKLALSFIKEGK